MSEEQLTMEYEPAPEQGKASKKKKKRRKKHYGLRILLVLALVFGALYFLRSSFFDITAIAVENNSFYTAEQLIGMSGARMGENIFSADVRGMREELLKDAYVRSAAVRRHFPRELRIYVDERSEDAALLYGQEYIIIDLDGMVLRRTNTEPKLPVLVGPTIVNMETGTPVEVEESAIFTDTLKMIGVMNESNIFFKRIDVSSVIVKAYIYDNLVVQGTPSNLVTAMEDKTLQAVIYDLILKGTERGTISVGSDQYISFSPALS